MVVSEDNTIPAFEIFSRLGRFSFTFFLRCHSSDIIAEVERACTCGPTGHDARGQVQQLVWSRGVRSGGPEPIDQPERGASRREAHRQGEQPDETVRPTSGASHQEHGGGGLLPAPDEGVLKVRLVLPGLGGGVVSG